MNDTFSRIAELYRGRVNLLIIDDDPTILKSLQNTFLSPAFSVRTFETYNDALNAVRDVSFPGHCRIFDVDLGETRSGIDLIKADPGCPFVLILSGLQSMRTAADAVLHGAMAVFDKVPRLLDNLYDETCRVAALGFLLNGKNTQYLPLYRVLCDSVITTPEEWAEKACVSVRQLHRICELHPVTTPRASLAIYYSIYSLLWKGAPPFKAALPPDIGQKNSGYIDDCIKYCLKKRVLPEL